MRGFSILVLCFLMFACSTQKKLAPVDDNKRGGAEVIAFGSCNKAYKPQVMWDAIMKQSPFMWIWLGDIIYGDTEDMNLLKEKYDCQKNHPEYQAFRSEVPIYGIWDDHDYGVNDGNKYYARKRESRDLLFDFLDVPGKNQARQREGAYQSYTLEADDKTVKLILLDGRYFRDPLREDRQTKQRYLPNKSGDLLGELQWAFLRHELQSSNADIHLIACGIQFIPTEHYYEKWSNFPESRARLFALLSELQPKNPVLLSGDRHIAEVSSITLENYDHPIYEVTASGMTHTWANKKATETNAYRKGPLVINENYGLLRIQWDREPYITAEIRNETNDLLLQVELEGYSF